MHIMIDGDPCELQDDLGVFPVRVKRLSDGCETYLGLGPLHWGTEVSGIMRVEGALMYSFRVDGKRRIASHNPKTGESKILTAIFGNCAAIATVETRQPA